MNAMDEVIKLFYNIQVALSSIQSPEKLVVRARSSVPLLSFSPAKEEKKTLNPKILFVYPKNIKYRDLVLSERLFFLGQKPLKVLTNYRFYLSTN